jgi:hypothetical protein
MIRDRVNFHIYILKIKIDKNNLVKKKFYIKKKSLLLQYTSERSHQKIKKKIMYGLSLFCSKQDNV